jgi:ABC-type oligopeptide transport system ATPase subunit
MAGHKSVPVASHKHPLVIHVSGASGSGKTTLGKKIERRFRGHVVVKDMDDLRDEFIRDFYKGRKWTFINTREYQKYIDAFVKAQRKPVVLVGLTDNSVYGKNKRIFIDPRALHKFYIDVDDPTILRQKCTRLLTDIQTDIPAMRDLKRNNTHFIAKFTEAIRRECSLAKTIAASKALKRDYMGMGYEPLPPNHIYTRIVGILRSHIRL